MENSELSKTVRTFDARTWAKSFNETLVALGYHPHDEGWLICWFANSIMCGYDEASRHAERIQLLPLDKDKVKSYLKSLSNWIYEDTVTDNIADCICSRFGTPNDAVSASTVEKIEEYLFDAFSVDEYEKMKDEQMPVAKTATEARVYETNKYTLRIKLQLLAQELYGALITRKLKG